MVCWYGIDISISWYSRLNYRYRIRWVGIVSGQPFTKPTAPEYLWLWTLFFSRRFDKNKDASFTAANQWDSSETFHTARTISLHVMIHISVLSPAAAQTRSLQFSKSASEV